MAWPTNGQTDWNTAMAAYVGVGHATDGTHNEAGLGAQTQYSVSGAKASGATVFVDDDTIPQLSTEGNTLTALNTAITPKSATNYLIIDCMVSVSHSVAAKRLMLSLHQDSNGDALCVASGHSALTTGIETIHLRHIMLAGQTTATTFKINYGSPDAGTVTVNGYGDARKQGGVLISSMIIREVWV